MTRFHSEQQEADEGSIPRRAVVQAAAWTIPVVALAVNAPLAAASQPCATGAVNWGSNYSQIDRDSGAGTVTTSTGASIPFTVSSTFGPSVIPVDSNLSTGGGYLNLNSAATGSNTGNYDANYNVVTRFQFDSPISNIRFGVGDIESQTNPASGSIYREWVRVVNTPGVTATPGANISISGNGLYYTNVFASTTVTDPAHRVEFHIAGPVTYFDVLMSRPGSNGGTGGVGMSGVLFDAC